MTPTKNRFLDPEPWISSKAGIVRLQNVSYLNESGKQIFDEGTEASLPDNIKAYLGYAALRFNETNYIEDVYSLDLEESVVKNINNDIITYKLQGQFSELEVTIDFYNERVHLEHSIIYGEDEITMESESTKRFSFLKNSWKFSIKLL